MVFLLAYAMPKVCQEHRMWAEFEVVALSCIFDKSIQLIEYIDFCSSSSFRIIGVRERKSEKVKGINETRTRNLN